MFVLKSIDMSAPSTFKKIIRLALICVAILVLFFAGFLIWQTAREFKPEPIIQLAVAGEATVLHDTLTASIYNIGYCGLGAEMDFFYEGGKMARPEKALLDKYENAVIERLRGFSDNDFILLQEVDTLAKRSWHSNQLAKISDGFPEYDIWFALNYKSWVPMPVTNPMGKVRAGLATMSAHMPAEVERVAFKSGYSWPMSLFMLKRCFLVSRYKTSYGNDFVLVNTHNSAFSDAAEIRKTELAQLKELMETEYSKGNFVLIGGDWNQNPPDFDTTLLLPHYLPKVIEPPIPDDYLPDGWLYVYDPLHSTNRNVEIPYTAGITQTTLIDFFVTSPNIEIISVKTTDTGFAESDHQPVTIKFVLRK
jgi:endonuclease/exonuclease/phosphatase family metal-dependent hydrolase